MAPQQHGCLALLCLLASGASVLADSLQSNSFTFTNWEGPPLTVFFWEPQQSCQQLLFVIHGVDRNAEHYLNRWKPYAQEHGCAIAAPQFDHTTFPTSIQFQLGNTTTAEGRLNAAQHWTFSCIEPLFNHILQHYPRVQASTYALYGHSAGAQFVTRFLFHVQPSRCSMALAANAGWYTLPDLSLAWPYGLQKSALIATLPHAWQASLAQKLVLLLGDQDTDTSSKHLRKNPEVMSQGPHRFARGHTFYAVAKETAKGHNISFGWQLVVVQGVGHSNKQMIPAAVQQLQQSQNWQSAGDRSVLDQCPS